MKISPNSYFILFLHPIIYNYMSIVQRIRDKYAAIVIAVIALSLIAFILMDAFVGRSKGAFFQNSSTVAKINDKKVDISVFREKIDLQEQQYQMSGMKVDDAMRQQIMQAIWDQVVNETLINTECEKLGIEITPKELSGILFGKNPPDFMQREFVDKATGQYDIEKAKQYFTTIKKRSNDPQAQLFMQVYIEPLMQNVLYQKYVSLFAQAAYIPKWLNEKQIADNGAVASASIVQIPYNTISDSIINISEDDIKKYLVDHKKEYTQDQANRSIAYVFFGAAPTSSDSAVIFTQIKDNKAVFDTTSNMQDFLNQVGTETKFYDEYISKAKIQMPAIQKDSIEKGKTIIGPYIDGKNYVLARVLGVKNIPDSVKCRHILIATHDPQSGQPIIEDSIAKKRIDSIATAIKAGAKFDEMAKQFSDDPGSKDKGGVYDYFTQGQMVKEFNNFCFEGYTGDKGVIKTDYGYHYVEILDQKNIGPAYKIAYLSKTIEASPETINNANNAAAQFAGQSTTTEAFDDNVKKLNKIKLIAQDIHENDYTIQNIGANRTLVKWIYEHKVGDVSEPFSVEDKYIVATVIQADEDGTMSVSKAKLLIEPILKNKKKAEKIISKINKNMNLESIATQFGRQVNKIDSINFSAAIMPNMGIEPKVCGAVFNKNWKGKISDPIAGNSGVFLIRTETINAHAVMDASSQQAQLKSTAIYRTAESLRKAATIKDYRVKFY